MTKAGRRVPFIAWWPGKIRLGTYQETEKKETEMINKDWPLCFMMFLVIASQLVLSASAQDPADTRLLELGLLRKSRARRPDRGDPRRVGRHATTPRT